MMREEIVGHIIDEKPLMHSVFIQEEDLPVPKPIMIEEEQKVDPRML